MPHVADAVEAMMARDAGGAVPVRIQINIYGEDGIDSVVHSLHIHHLLIVDAVVFIEDLWVACRL